MIGVGVRLSTCCDSVDNLATAHVIAHHHPSGELICSPRARSVKYSDVGKPLLIVNTTCHSVCSHESGGGLSRESLSVGNLGSVGVDQISVSYCSKELEASPSACSAEYSDIGKPQAHVNTPCFSERSSGSLLCLSQESEGAVSPSVSALSQSDRSFRSAEDVSVIAPVCSSQATLLKVLNVSHDSVSCTKGVVAGLESHTPSKLPPVSPCESVCVNDASLGRLGSQSHEPPVISFRECCARVGWDVGWLEEPAVMRVDLRGRVFGLLDVMESKWEVLPGIDRSALLVMEVVRSLEPLFDWPEGELGVAVRRWVDGLTTSDEDGWRAAFAVAMRRPGDPCAGACGSASRMLSAHRAEEGETVEGGTDERIEHERRDLTQAQREALEAIRPRWKRAGDKDRSVLAAHASFLQFYFRQSRIVRPGCWRRGGLRGFVLDWPRVKFQCEGGKNLASTEHLAAARRSIDPVLGWYRCYVQIYQRLTGGGAAVVDTFCKAGAVSDGFRRMGSKSMVGVDCESQHNYTTRFGDNSFLQEDATSPLVMRDVVATSGAMGVWASTPCQPHSTMRRGGVASSVDLLDQMRNVLNGTGKLFISENVLGAHRKMVGHVSLLRGSMFGLGVDRGRCFESNFPIHIDQVLRDNCSFLRPKMCLGGRRRWGRQDVFGRPLSCQCCVGNLFPVQGDEPLGTLAENAEAMGVDLDHMSYAELSQAVPPVYASYLYGQLAMHACHREFGMPIMSYDDMLRDPEGSRRVMRHWLRGVGDVSATSGMAFTSSDGVEGGGGVRGNCESHEANARILSSLPTLEVSEGCVDCDDNAPFEIDVASGRGLYYSWGGDFDRVISRATNFSWLDGVAHMDAIDVHHPNSDCLRGGKVLVFLGDNDFYKWWDHLVDCEFGTRVTIMCKLDSCAFNQLSRLVTTTSGWRRVNFRGSDVLPWAAFSRGVVPVAFVSETLPIGDLDEFRDGVDVGLVEGPSKSHKGRCSWQPIGSLVREAWESSTASDELKRALIDGVRIGVGDAAGFTEVASYDWPSDAALRAAISECDRHLAIGALEFVDELPSDGFVHPWLIVDQGAKWRLCHDQSVLLNLFSRPRAFSLPSPWDLLKRLKPGRSLIKYDLRDMFFHIEINEHDRRWMMVRHPATKRLLRCRRIPFGWNWSPYWACSLSEFLASEFRREASAAGLDADAFVFVDDYLLEVADEHVDLAQSIMENIFERYGVEFSEFKKRGPCKLLDFLGLMISTVEGRCGIALPLDKADGLRAMVDEWLDRRPVGGGKPLEVCPVDLARLLGRLVFASPCVPGGKIMSQSILSQFRGLMEVDWIHGRVKVRGGNWSTMTVDDEFWRDLEMWRDMLRHNHLVAPNLGARACSAVMAGTDASDWGTGQLIWLDGEREEVQLEFSSFEKGEPINWRELLGMLRVFQFWGWRMRDSLALLEADNMTSVRVLLRGGARSEGMRELVRRLARITSAFNIEVRPIHTPGVALHRPDQTSRGVSVCEPRQRLKLSVFSQIADSMGPFSGFLGAERGHVVERGIVDGECIFVHPTYKTVAAALFRIRERAVLVPDLRAVVIVPYAPTAGWWSMLKDFSFVRMIESNLKAFEEMSMYGWRSSPVIRDAWVLHFPRIAGGRVVPLVRDVGACDAPSGYDVVGADGQREAYLRLGKGEFVYAPSRVVGMNGVFYVVMEDFDSRCDGVVMTAELFILSRDVSRVGVVSFEASKRSVQWTGPKECAWPCVASELWRVTSLCEEYDLATSSKMPVNPWWFKGVRFDWRRAEAEIAASVCESERASDLGVDLTVEAVRDGDVSWGGIARDRAPPLKPAARGASASIQICDYAGTRCGGCGGGFQIQERMNMRGLTPRHERCGGAVEAPINVVTSKKEALMRETLSTERVDAVLRCLGGTCIGSGRTVVCKLGCGARVHVDCVQLSKGHATLGNLTCIDCRVKELGLEGKMGRARERRLCVTLLLELTSGATGTASGYCDYDQLEDRYLAELDSEEVGAFPRPRHSCESFKGFVSWMVTDAARAGSLDTVIRSAGALMTKLGLTDWTKDKGVKALIAQLSDLAAHEKLPQTLSTRLMLVGLIFEVLPRRYQGRLLSRWDVTIKLESVCGMRIGEITGELHGLLAKDIVILTDRTSGERFVDVKVADSKTGHTRYISVVGKTTRSKINVADGLLLLASDWGINLLWKSEGAYDIIHFDYWVVRVSLLALGAGELSALKLAIVNSTVKAVSAMSAYLLETIRARINAKGGDEKKHINLWGGPRTAPQAQMLMRELKARGVGGARISHMPGPLLRATCSRGSGITHTAMDPKSTLSQVGSLMNEAFDEVCNNHSHDPELDLMGRTVPYFRNHANRRFADKVAREAMRRGLVSDVDIDIFFGWKQKEHAQNSQLHYAGEGRGDRVRRSLVTRDL